MEETQVAEAGDPARASSGAPLARVRPAAGAGRVTVFKFGGSSLANTERILHAARLVREAALVGRTAVVVSAMGGITDRLFSIAQSLESGDRALATAEAHFVLHLHREVVRELELGTEEQRRLSGEIEALGRDLLAEVALKEHVAFDAEALDRLVSFGERFSCRLLAAALNREGVAAVPVVASDFVLTTGEFQNARPVLAETREQGREVLRPLLEAGLVPVVTGYIGATAEGRITTLGRNSSDYSGAVVAHVLDAAELVIWTDVDGIYSANPHAEASARLLSDLTYEEAHALAASGARVLHPDVLPLAAETNLVVWVRNSKKPSARGTRIGVDSKGRMS